MGGQCGGELRLDTFSCRPYFYRVSLARPEEPLCGHRGGFALRVLGVTWRLYSCDVIAAVHANRLCRPRVIELGSGSCTCSVLPRNVATSLERVLLCGAL